MNAVAVHCPKCGRSVPLDAPAGLCPYCLAMGGLTASDDGPDPAADIDSKATLHIVIPEELGLPTGTPRRLGKYELIDEIARGGMGIVYRARHTGLDCMVAVKMIRSGVLAKDADVERFQREARAAARLQHPNIVRIHDIGEQDGQHYFSMDYVAGANLAELARVKPFTPKQAAEITAGVAAAIQYAHGQGVLHRDIKPSNVILTPEQKPRVLDFGLARILADDSQLTVSGTPMGSPCYMSPEQARGELRGIDARSDIYSLGALLYELLTGRPPFQAPSTVETLKLVLETEVIPPRRFNAALPPDLETVCLKCLEKEPKRRYTSAQEVGQELDRFVHDQPIHARPVGQTERAWRWCRRNPVVASLGAATLALLIAVAVGSSVAAMRIERERQRAERHLYVANMNQVQQKWEQQNVMGVRELLQETSRFPERGFEWSYWHRLAFPELITLPQSGPALGVAFSPDGKRVVSTGTEDGTAQVWDLGMRIPVLTLKGHSSRINAVAFSSDAHRIVTGSGDRTARVWDALTGQELLPPFKGHKDGVNAVAFSPNGQWIVTSSADKTARVWDAATGQELLPPLKGHTAGINSVSVSPDGQRILTASSDKTAKVWDRASGKVLLSLTNHPDAVNVAVFSPDGRWIVTACGENVDRNAHFVAAFEHEWTKPGATTPATMQPAGPKATSADAQASDSDTHVQKPDTRVALPHPAFPQRRAVVSAPNAPPISRPSEKWMSDSWVRQQMAAKEKLKDSPTRDLPQPAYELATLEAHTEHPTTQIWDAATGQPLLTLEGHSARIQSVAFSPDGRHLATASLDHTVQIWDALTGTNLGTLEGHDDAIFSVAFSPDGRRIVTGSGDRTVKVWPGAPLPNPLILAEPDQGIFPFTAVAALRGQLGFTEWTRPIGVGLGILSVMISPDGQRIITGCGDGAAKVWDMIDARPKFTLKSSGVTINSVAWSADGRRLATASSDHSATVWDAASSRELFVLKGHTDGIVCVAFSPDGHWIATGSGDRTAKLWDAATGRPRRTLEGHSNPVLSVAFSPDSQTLVTASNDGTAVLWKVADGQRLRRFSGHQGQILAVAFSPDGQRIVTGSGDRTAKVWDMSSGKELFSLKGHAVEIRAVAFSPDGRRILTGSGDSTAKLWDASTCKELLTFKGHSEAINAVAFSRNGQRIVTASSDGTARVWEADAQQR